MVVISGDNEKKIVTPRKGIPFIISSGSWVAASLIALKQLVLDAFLELSEQPIHFSNASGRFLSISDEFSGDYGASMGDYGM